MPWLRLGIGADGCLVAFQVDGTGTYATEVRLADPKERTKWERLLERRASRKNGKLKRGKDAAPQWEPSGVLRHVLKVEATRPLGKKRRPKSKSIMLIGRGETRKEGSHRDNRGHR